MNWRGLLVVLGGFALAGLTGCDGAIAPVDNESNGQASCSDICPEQVALEFKVPAYTEREVSLAVIHAKGQLSSSHERLTVTALSDYASSVTYRVETKFGEPGFFSDSFTLELHQDSTLMGSLAVPVEYESYQAFRVFGAVPSFGSGPRQFTMPADVPAGIASVNNLITTTSDAVTIKGTYANWRIENVTDGLVISPESGQGAAELDISFVSGYQQGAGVQRFHFDIIDDHSGKSETVYFSVDAHQEAVHITPKFLTPEILSTTQFEDLSWKVQLLDATAGLHTDRQLNWRFVDIPENFMVEPSEGHSGRDTDVTISRLHPLTGQDIDRYYYFQIEFFDENNNVVASSKRVMLWLDSQVPMINDITPRQLAFGDQSLILLEIKNAHKPFEMYLNGERIPYKKAGHFYALDADLVQGESILSVYNGQSSGLYDQHTVVLNADREYQKGRVQLSETPSVLRYQPSTQSWVYLGQEGIVYAMQFLEGGWRTIQCVSDFPIVDIERAYDELMAISSSKIYRLTIEHDMCYFSEQYFAQRDLQFLGPNYPFVDIDFSAMYRSPSPAYLTFKTHNRAFEGPYPALEQRSLFANSGLLFSPDSYSFTFAAEEKQLLISDTRDAFIHTSNSIFSDIGYEGASISDDASVVVLANGDVYRLRRFGYEAAGQLTQASDGSVISTLVSRDGSRAWHLHLKGQRSWISEYDLTSLEVGVQILGVRNMDLDLPEGFTWEKGNFLEMQSSPGDKLLTVTLNDWLWTVPL